jgi:hypothetical protein
MTMFANLRRDLMLLPVVLAALVAAAGAGGQQPSPSGLLHYRSRPWSRTPSFHITTRGTEIGVGLGVMASQADPPPATIEPDS